MKQQSNVAQFCNFTTGESISKPAAIITTTKCTKIFLLLLWRAIIATAVAAYEKNHPFIRRAQLTLLPWCGDPLCWCDLNAPSSTSSECPLYPSESIYTGQTDVTNFYDSLELKNPKYIDLQLCAPDLSSSVNLDSISVDPDILCETGILNCDESKPRAECIQSCRHHGNQAVCGIELKSDKTKIWPDSDAHTTSCSPTNCLADSYKVETFSNDVQRVKNGFFLLHEGACGVCSTAQDLASYMRYSFSPDQTIDMMSFFCQSGIVASNPGIEPKELVEQVSTCLADKAGLSETCAYAWAINVFLTGLPEGEGGCNEICTVMLGLLQTPGACTPAVGCPYDDDTCALHDCLRCDDKVSGKQFIELAGMTRRNAGIHTLLPRPCGSLADVPHTCVSLLY